MVYNILKIATKVIMSNPKLRNKAQKIASETYTKIEPHLKDKIKEIKSTKLYDSALENTSEVIKNLKDKFKT